MTGGEVMKSINLGICENIYSIRIPDKLKKCTDSLSPAEEKDLKDEILIAMAKVCHRANFNPSVFLAD